MGKLTIGAGHGFTYDPSSADYPSSEAPLSAMGGTAFSGALDASGFLTISLTDANTYSASFDFQQPSDFPASAALYRDDPDTAHLRIKSANGSADSGKTIAGRYWLT